MLADKHVEEIKGHLNKAQNPIFFFDNDPDGLCSFLLLQRWIKRGRGIAIKSFPDLIKGYFRKITELNADYIFILDKPEVSSEFLEEVNKFNIPVVWIDHHKIDKTKVPEFVNYFNPVFNDTPTNEPVTALCYQITQDKKDLWLAMAGCISDKFVPNYYGGFCNVYPDLSINSEDAFEIFYTARIGRIARMFSFALKDTTTNVVKMLKFLMKVRTPYEVLEECSANYSMHQRFNYIDKKYQKFLQKAKEVGENCGKVLFFQYGGDLSISSDLSNELSFLFPKKIIVVIYPTGGYANISIRGKNIRESVLKVLSELEGATGGGHESAVGARIKLEDVEKFKKNFESFV